jgi:SAM-dependent methyltransferase
MLGYYYKSNDDTDFVENFQDYTKMTFYDQVSKIYDKFYAKVYDTLFASDIKNEFEIYNIRGYTILEQKHFQPSDIKILDMGCGTGKHLKILDREKYKCMGIDNSMDMLEMARLNAPDVPLIRGNITNRAIFKNRQFSHVMCTFYTMYYLNREEQETLFKNANYWLKPNGYFCLHLVNPQKFDPVLERSSKLIPFYNPQKHVRERATKSKLKFNKFNYVSDWNFEGSNVQFVENFLFNDASMHRQHVHKFTMYPIKYYVKLANKNGFKLVKIIDLLPVSHDNNYIYIFQKKYGN